MKIVWKKIVPELKIHKWRVIAVILLGVWVSALKSVTPWLTNQMVDKAWGLSSATGKFDQRLAIFYPLAIAGIWILANIGRYFHIYWMKWTADLVAVKLRRDLM